jgi:transcriptional regulator GlxA family with amidase domain
VTVSVAQRVVEDRNRITAGGVTAGIDLGLQVAARLRGEQDACRLELLLEYDPRPPFRAASPERAGTELTNQVRSMRALAVAAARQAALIAQKRLATA